MLSRQKCHFLSKLQFSVPDSTLKSEKQINHPARDSYKHSNTTARETNRADELNTEKYERLKSLIRRISHVPKLFIHRRYRLRSYSKCVPGTKLVDYLLSAKEEGISTREEALQLAEALFSAGAIYSVSHCRSKEFKDSKQLYTYYPAFAWESPK